MVGKGLWDDIPIQNLARDKAWEEFIKRKDIEDIFDVDPEFNFPLAHAWYTLWKLCWHRAWDDGFHEGWQCCDRHRDGLEEKNSAP